MAAHTVYRLTVDCMACSRIAGQECCDLCRRGEDGVRAIGGKPSPELELDRYLVCSLTGLSKTGKEPAASYWVADTWLNYREVARYFARGGHHRVSRPGAAQAECDRLNRDHRAAIEATG